ncbi:efflux RND transporter periplasmic adaptor subunit [Ottowia cancrivicina]|uniref:HlyD family efflux transporter periplasmic adaptor subunit n=1 Tax=Ottowia cancrivicina TaxID=3040346 RepID=A0AAW6RLS3_9BURK|nr:HlyD family efflux transporter periplasmic adaptor subunit [Ottowia sp. 10c7w1]MDG9699727.1 HlyD family efflux transporter periplasmic adaptor subunit [Ottowia sp. 10c7w1]
MTLPRKALYFVLAASFIGALAFLTWREPRQLAATGAVTQGPLQETFTEEAKTRLKQRYAIAAPVSGTLQRITLEPGDAVQQGQPVAYIAPAASTLLDDRSRAQAEADVKSGQSQQAAASQRIAAARAAHQLAQASLKRARALAAGQAASQEALDQAQAAATRAAAELAAAQADEQAAIARVAAARATLAHEGAAGESGARAPQPVLSPVSGVVLRRSLQSATPVAAGQSLMEVGDTAQLEIEAEVLSTDAVRLAPGMTARVLRWGGPAPLQARVTRVEPGGFTKVSALGVQEQRTRVILELTSPRADWAALGDAWRVETEFITRQEENAVQVPASALFRTAATEGGAGSTGGWALYVVENGRARLTPVRVGLRSDAAAQILEGAAPGQTVILQPDDRIHDGVRIQPA